MDDKAIPAFLYVNEAPIKPFDKLPYCHTIFSPIANPIYYEFITD